jgi:hypothetical protein
MGNFASATADPAVGPVGPGPWKGVLLLREAWAAAHAAGRDVWEFAVEVGELRAAGLSHTDLRCLLAGGLAEHAAERTDPLGKARHFEPLANLAIPDGACFILTAAGAALTGPGPAGRAWGPRLDGAAAGPAPPHWDGLLRRLCWQGLLVKEYRQPAANQELILAALEEEGWPARVDDPLPRGRDQDPKARLRAAVKALNGHQLHRLIRFRCDGTGEGVGWGATRGA